MPVIDGIHVNNKPKPPRRSGLAAPSFRSTFKSPDELQKEIWSPQKINQLANRGGNVLAAGAADRARAIRESLAGTGAAGAEIEAIDQVNQETALAAQNARTEAELSATRDNADWSMQRNAAQARDRQQDIDAMLGMGNLELGERGLANERRGQDINWDTSRLDADVSYRGQDIERENAGADRDLAWGQTRLNAAMEGRGQDIDWLGTQLGFDVQQREQDADFAAERGRQRLAGRGQDVDMWGRRLEADVAQRRDDMDYGAERGRQRIAGRGQDLDWLARQLDAETTRRGQTLGYDVDRGRLDSDNRRTDMGYETDNRRIDADYERERRRADIDDRNAWAEYEQGNRAQEIEWLRSMLSGAGQLGSLDVAQRGQDIGYQSDLYGNNTRREDARLAALLQMLRAGY